MGTTHGHDGERVPVRPNSSPPLPYPDGLGRVPAMTESKRSRGGQNKTGHGARITDRLAVTLASTGMHATPAVPADSWADRRVSPAARARHPVRPRVPMPAAQAPAATRPAASARPA